MEQWCYLILNITLSRTFNSTTICSSTKTAYKNGNSSYLSFRMGWDDCPSGCLRERVWTFSVDQTTCNVTYISVSGHAVTDYNNGPPYQPDCNILLSNTTLPSTVAAIQVYPNPTPNLLYVEGANQHIQLYNAMGNLVLEEVVANTTTTLNLEVVPKGIYLLVVDNKTTQKVVKQ
ncbi:MAG: T9SS type A sorting domain-containing protein [Aureispira sp.]